jgi:hypothetical protein
MVVGSPAKAAPSRRIRSDTVLRAGHHPGFGGFAVDPLRTIGHGTNTFCGDRSPSDSMSFSSVSTAQRPIA